MKSKLVTFLSLLVLISLNMRCLAYGPVDSFPGKIQSEWVLDDSTASVSKKDLKIPGKFDTFLVGARVNYMQGKYGFLGCSGTFMWHEVGYVLESHLGFSAGMDFRLTKSMVYAPKIAFEYRYLIGVARVGYAYYSDFKSDFDHRISAEIGLSLLSFIDITYLHSFGSARNPFHLGNDYVNITATIPLNL
nr:hypothetical protein [uncultured Fluviicola sp.]